MLPTMGAALSRREPSVPGSPDRPLAPDQPAETPQRLRVAGPDSARLTDRPADADRPAPWSRPDLRLRLDRLPPGHPSSPDLATQREAAPDAHERSYWNEVPRFMNAWADHLRRWPEASRTAAVDRTRDPPGSWRGDGNQYLNPQQHTQAKDAIAGVQQTEKSLTRDMTAAQRENTNGGRLAGMEFRLKGEDRLKEKLAEKLEHEPNRTPTDALREINDVIRYTFCFESDNYADGYKELKQRLETSEYRMTYSKNHWRDDPEYKGINTRWVGPESQRFEIQFHTPESFHAKQRVTHVSYERSRNQLTARAEQLEIEAFHRQVCTFIAAPSKVESILDYQEEDS